MVTDVARTNYHTAKLRKQEAVRSQVWRETSQGKVLVQASSTTSKRTKIIERITLILYEELLNVDPTKSEGQMSPQVKCATQGFRIASQPVIIATATSIFSTREIDTIRANGK